MAALPNAPFVTPEEYLERERYAEIKSEYHNGVIVAMAGSSPEHSAITFNLNVQLGSQLRKSGCRGFSSDLRVRVPMCNKYFYPDLTIVCGEPKYQMLSGLRSLLNPTLIIEVLSDTTEAVDRGEKWRCYRMLGSLQTYVLIDQDRPQVEVFSRMEEGDWRLHTVEGLEEIVVLPAIGCELTLSDVYTNVELPELSAETEDAEPPIGTS